MHIHTTGIDFECPVCKINATCNCSADIHAVRCNNSTEYYIICPNCNIKIRVPPEQIPSHIKSYIKVQVKGIMYYHD